MNATCWLESNKKESRLRTYIFPIDGKLIQKLHSHEKYVHNSFKASNLLNHNMLLTEYWHGQILILDFCQFGKKRHKAAGQQRLFSKSSHRETVFATRDYLRSVTLFGDRVKICLLYTLEYLKTIQHLSNVHIGGVTFGIAWKVRHFDVIELMKGNVSIWMPNMWM